MITADELAMVEAATGNKALPGITTAAGDPLATSQLLSYHDLPTNPHAPVYYDAINNRVVVQQAGAVVSGYNFDGTKVVVMANNVTIKDSNFNTAAGYYAIDQFNGHTGLTVENNSFNGAANNNAAYAAFVTGGTGHISIINNSFVDAPSDGVHVENGSVSGNYFEGAGYGSTLHPDAVYVGASTGPVDISNNFIDWTNNANAVAPTNNAVRITSEEGTTSDVSVHDNVLLGGSTTINAGCSTGTSDISISNNYIGFGAYGAFYSSDVPGSTISGNQIIDYTNRAYSDQAWQAYQAASIHTDHLLVEPAGGGVNLTPSGGGTTTVYGGGDNEHLFGNSDTTVFVGGFGTQYFWGGSGKDIYTYLSIADSTATGGEDLIANFDVSKDVFDFSHIDANPLAQGPQSFTFIGNAAFGSAGGEIRVVQDVAHNTTYVEADLVGDTSADMIIRVQGLVNLTAANFVGTQETEVTASVGAGVYGAGKTLALTVDMNNPVDVANGTPTLSLNDGGTAVYDAAHSTATQLVFDYTVGAGDSTAALAVTGINLNGATVTDAAGNAAGFTGLQTTFAGVQVDTSTPTVTAAWAHDAALHCTISTTAKTGVLAGDSDAVATDPLSVAAVDGAAANVGHAVAGTYGNLTLYADGHYSYTETSAPGQAVGEDVFQVTVTNQAGATSTSSLNVIVTQSGLQYVAGAAGQTITNTSAAGAVLDGHLGNQHLVAGAGAVSLIGGNQDVLTAGGGADTFVFGPASFGQNTISNFNAAVDTIQLDHTEFANFAAVMAHTQQVGANAVITLDGADTVTLTGVQAANLHAGNFHLV